MEAFIAKVLLYLLYALLGALGSVLGWLFYIYNSFIRASQRVDETWANTDAALKRRSDLIPNMIETVRGYATHERETLTRLTEARASIMGAGTLAKRAEAENIISGALKSLFAVAENYPDLKASENFLVLQRELASMEQDIQGARRDYNGAVGDYNTKIQSFPAKFVAVFFRFHKREFFGIEPTEREAPKVKF